MVLQMTPKEQAAAILEEGLRGCEKCGNCNPIKCVFCGNVRQFTALAVEIERLCERAEKAEAERDALRRNLRREEHLEGGVE